MKKFKVFLASLGLVTFGGLSLAAAPAVSAYDPLDTACDGVTSVVCDKKDENITTPLGKIINTLLFIVGALAVLMIIVSGIMYVTSTGDAPKVAKAKNTLMYSIVGLVVAFLAYAIVNWVYKVL